MIIVQKVREIRNRQVGRVQLARPTPPFQAQTEDPHTENSGTNDLRAVMKRKKAVEPALADHNTPICLWLHLLRT